MFSPCSKGEGPGVEVSVASSQCPDSYGHPAVLKESWSCGPAPGQRWIWQDATCLYEIQHGPFMRNSTSQRHIPHWGVWNGQERQGGVLSKEPRGTSSEIDRYRARGTCVSRPRFLQQGWFPGGIWPKAPQWGAAPARPPPAAALVWSTR